MVNERVQIIVWNSTAEFEETLTVVQGYLSYQKSLIRRWRPLSTMFEAYPMIHRNSKHPTSAHWLTHPHNQQGNVYFLFLHKKLHFFRQRIVRKSTAHFCNCGCCPPGNEATRQGYVYRNKRRIRLRQNGSQQNNHEVYCRCYQFMWSARDWEVLYYYYYSLS